MQVSWFPDDPIAATIGADHGFDPDNLFGRLLGRYSQLAASTFLPNSAANLPPLPMLLNAAFPDALNKFTRRHIAPCMLDVALIRRAIANPRFAPDGRVFMAHLARPLPDNLIAHAWRQAWTDHGILSAASAAFDLDNHDAAITTAVLRGLLDIPLPILCHGLALLTLVINQDARGALSPGFLFRFLHQFADKAASAPVADLSMLAALIRSSHPAPAWLPRFLLTRPRRSFPLLNAWQAALATPPARHQTNPVDAPPPPPCVGTP